MAKNDFKAFATDRNANVMSQEEWEALPALLSGFTAGKASSAQVNKVIRQASFIAAALAQFVSDKTQRDVLDNGDLPGFVELLGSGFAVEYLSRKNPFGDIKSDGTVQTALENLGLGEAAKLGSPDFSFSGSTFIAKFPGKSGGSNRTIVIQGTQVTIPQATSGNISTMSVNWPTPFPTYCQFTIVSPAGTTHAPAGVPFFGVAPVDRMSCNVSSTYTASASSAFILGVGY
ncbi:phage tail protein [Escherichia coli]|nr:phage tail protein [Escherichia coli]